MAERGEGYAMDGQAIVATTFHVLDDRAPDDCDSAFLAVAYGGREAWGTPPTYPIATEGCR